MAAGSSEQVGRHHDETIHPHQNKTTPPQARRRKLCGDVPVVRNEPKRQTPTKGELAPVLWEILKDIDALRDETLELARHANRKEEP